MPIDGRAFLLLGIFAGTLTSGCVDDGYYGPHCTQYVIYGRLAESPGEAPVDIRNTTIVALRDLDEAFAWTPSRDSWFGSYETYDETYDQIPQHLSNLSLEQNGTPEWTSVVMNSGTLRLKYGTDDGCTD